MHKEIHKTLNNENDKATCDDCHKQFASVKGLKVHQKRFCYKAKIN